VGLRDRRLVELKTDPLMDPLRKEPGFQASERESSRFRSPDGLKADIQPDTSRTGLPQERRRSALRAVALPVAVALDGPHAAYCGASAAARARRSLATNTGSRRGQVFYRGVAREFAAREMRHDRSLRQIG
jgi:hypothetical protein